MKISRGANGLSSEMPTKKEKKEGLLASAENRAAFSAWSLSGLQERALPEALARKNLEQGRGNGGLERTLSRKVREKGSFIRRGAVKGSWRKNSLTESTTGRRVLSPKIFPAQLTKGVY